MKRPLRCAAAALALLLPVPAARADPFHAQTLPLGQRALGMGGAFTAVADDPSTAYYNPAGIVLTSDGSLSASLTLTAFDRVDIKGGYRTSAGTGALSHNTAASLPVFVAAAKHLGPRVEGRRRHAVALSSFTVDQRRLSFDLEVRRARVDGEDLQTLAIGSTDRTAWNGFSYAYRLHGSLAVGVSSFLSITRTRQVEERIGAVLDAVNADGSLSTQASSWTTHLLESNIKNFVGRLGVLYMPSETLRLGLMFQPPSIHVRGRARVRERRMTTDLTGDGASSLFNAQRRVSSYRPLPWELRCAGSLQPASGLTFSLDASLYGPTGSRARPVIAFGPRKADPETGARPGIGAFASDTWYRTWNGNLALGGEVIIEDSIAVRAGIYTDLSSAPPIPRYASVYRAPDVHRVGGSVSVGLVSDGFDLSVGAIGVYGRGDALSFNEDPASDARYGRTRVTDRMFLLFINGVRNAVKSLAKKAEETLREIRDDDDDEQPRARPEPRE